MESFFLLIHWSWVEVPAWTKVSIGFSITKTRRSSPKFVRLSILRFNSHWSDKIVVTPKYDSQNEYRVHFF